MRGYAIINNDREPLTAGSHTEPRSIKLQSELLGVFGIAVSQHRDFPSGAGAFGQRSLGITVLGGMLAALLVGTFFIPGFYAIVQTIRERVKRKLGMEIIIAGEKPTST